MNVFEIFAERVETAIGRAALSDPDEPALDLSRIVVEPPRDPSHGDLSTNAAMVLAKPLGKKPRDLADRIANELRDDRDVAVVDIAGPGFINITLTELFWRAFLADLIATGDDYGRSDRGRGERVNVEFVSANPTGPLHVGHCRGAVLGDAIAALLDAAGYAVTREFYINDAGVQVDVLGRSVYLRYREALGEDVSAIPDGLYPGDYLKPVGKLLAERHGDALMEVPETEWLPIVRDTAIDEMLRLIRADLESLNVRHDVFFSERSLTGETNRVADAIESLRNHDLVYVGRLPPPKGQPSEDWEDRAQTLFRSTEFGDDLDRPLMKSDGSYTYFAGDIAYHYDKFRRGFRQMIDVLGADHGGYVKRLKAAVKGVSGGDASLDVKICQLVKLFRAGEPVKMSKRSGDFVKLRDVVDEVGSDAVRFMMVFRKSDAPLDFDFAKVTEQSKDNPVFYVQYAHARVRSVFRQAAEGDADLAAEFDADVASGHVEPEYFEGLGDQGERALLRRLADYPRIVDSAVTFHEPHRLAFYLYELASDLHVQWNRGKDNPTLRFINHDEPRLTKARLGLVHAVRLVLSSGLAILGVQAPDEMR